MRIGQICKREIATVGKRDRIVRAARLMRELHVGDLVVVDEKRQVVGLLTDRDLVVSVLAHEPLDVSALHVEDVMSEELVTASEDEDADQVLRRMRKFGVRRVPVLSGERALVGIVAFDDLVAWLADDVAELAAIARRQRLDEFRRRP